ncbi:membrane dipeptidase [Formivibrio citricus]|uniref:Membrane dipeptidase n=1 Tax=Formivibrio citricus TaxID=83765 RepID=A0A1I4WUB3_9NEIS|nr:membrane dipeptidase [Formivibrio citricus]SFN17045.1 membrane dipeptidase [Formivibrio citricus]
MDRRAFCAGAAALAAASSLPAWATSPALNRVDMHSHWGISARGGSGALDVVGLREAMTEAGLLLAAINIVADYPQFRRGHTGTEVVEYASPGSLRGYFDEMAEYVLKRARKDDLIVVGARHDLKSVLDGRKPGIVLAVEGADFLEGKLEPLKAARTLGVSHLQLVHYRLMEVGDICNLPPRYNGLSDFGKDVVRECNRLGMLVDVAHCSSAGILHALEISTQPLIYSHGWVSDTPPDHARRTARAIHAPLAKTIAAKGGVIGAFPMRQRTPEAFAAYLFKLVEALGVSHVGIGTDHGGLPRSALSGCRDLPAVAAELSRLGLKDAEIGAVMGGNYLRILQQAMSAGA